MVTLWLSDAVGDNTDAGFVLTWKQQSKIKAQYLVYCHLVILLYQVCLQTAAYTKDRAMHI